MIEMRWIKTNPMGNKVLQYRQKVDQTIYALAATNALSAECINNGRKNWQWSEWCDVPTVYVNCES